jgi:hypothetical protein
MTSVLPAQTDSIFTPDDFAVNEDTEHVTARQTAVLFDSVKLAESNLNRYVQRNEEKIAEIKRVDKIINHFNNLTTEDVSQAQLDKFTTEQLASIDPTDPLAEEMTRTKKTKEALAYMQTTHGLEYPSRLPDDEKKEALTKSLNNINQDLSHDGEMIQMEYTQAKNNFDNKIQLLSTFLADFKRIIDKIIEKMGR